VKRPKLTQTQQNAADWLIQVGYTTVRMLIKNGLPNHAAATAFYFMLSASPLLLILSYGIQWLTQIAEDSAAAGILLAALYEQLHLESLTDTGFIPQQAQLAAGGVGLLTLVLASRGLLIAIQTAFLVIFPAEAKRRLVVSTTLPLTIIPIAFALVGFSVLAKAVLGFFEEHALLGPATSLFLGLLSLAVSFGTVWSLIFLAYWRLPMQHPNAKQAAWMALVATLSLWLLYVLFGHLFRLENYQAMYGALGGVVFVLIGALFAWLIFYFWAQCLFALGKVDVAALERLFLGGGEEGSNKLETFVFGRSNRLIDKYGQTYAPGELLIREGDGGDRAFFLYSGTVGLYRDALGPNNRIAQLGAGELFGEMAYLLGEKRTATIKAETEVVALVLPPQTLEELMRYSAPLSRRIIGTLCQRLQRMNQVTLHQEG